MVRGLVVGKFLPPHLGHKYLIDTAAAQCDQLIVLVCDRPEYRIDAATRQAWLQAIHPDVDVRTIPDMLDDDDSAGWARNTIKFLGFRPDIVFSSEDYGHTYARYMKARHVLVDKPRIAVPISATAVRADPWKQWEYLHPIVRTYFAKRICLLGSESTGTTTLTKALARHYQTVWVPEYGRTYTIEQQKRLDIEGWQTSDFVTIAREQNRQEDEYAARADKLLFCDTDSFATSVWHERYMGSRAHEVEALAVGRPYELYLLTDVNIPFEQDGTRDGEAYREWMHERFQEKLRFWGKPYVIVTGTKQQRLRQATELIDTLLDGEAVRLPGLVRDAWHSGNTF